MGLEITYAICALFLLSAMIYGSMQYSRRNRAVAPITDAATKELYRDTDSYDETKFDKKAAEKNSTF